MTFHLQALAVTVFAVVMAAAAIEDFRRQIIPNLLPVLLCIFWPLQLYAMSAGVYDIVAALGCGLAAFLVGAVLFARGYLGGGDVKLLAAVILWAGPAQTLQLLMLTAVLGGVLASVLLLPFGRDALIAVRRLFRHAYLPAESGLAMPVPYGVAIAGAALIVVVTPYFG